MNTLTGKKQSYSYLQVTNHFHFRKIRKELVDRHRPRGCEGNVKAVNTKILSSVKECEKFLYYKTLILQNQKAVQL